MNRNALSLIGFDSLFDEIGNFKKFVSYPPNNLYRESSLKYVAEIAVAGFKKSEIEVKREDGKLKVSGKKLSTDDKPFEFFHRGLASRDFTLSYLLNDDIVVDKVSLEDGILKIVMTRVLPDAAKPVTFSIE